MSQPVTIQESARLIELEKTIQSGLQTFVEVGEALMEIRDSRLYRIEHGTFEDYCREKWGFTKTQANRLISAATVVETLAPMGAAPINERQARPLTKLDPVKQVEAWGKAVEKADGEQPTAKQVEEAVVEVATPIESESLSDAPAEIVPCEGMAWAEKAVKCLEKIQHTDAEKKRAYKFVRHWLSLRS